MKWLLLAIFAVGLVVVGACAGSVVGACVGLLAAVITEA